MDLVNVIRADVTNTLKALYGREFDLTISLTKPEFEGDYTVVLFSLVKQLKRSPEEIGRELGEGSHQ